MKKYYVVATAWIGEKPVKIIVGEFDDLGNAHIFKKAYEKARSVEAFIVEPREV